MHKDPKVSAGSLPMAAVDRLGPKASDIALYRDHYASLVLYTDRLREGRCRKTRRFEDDLSTTMAAFQPLFAPWNMEALFALYMRGPQRFSQLKKALGAVSSRVLTDKLRHLASEDLVHRGVADKRPLYSLSPKGDVVARHLHPILFYLHA